MKSCPRCHTHMSASTFDGRLKDSQGRPIAVTMDACPSCEGYWFDRLEVEATMGLPHRLAQLIDEVRDTLMCHRCFRTYPVGTPECSRCDAPLALTCPGCAATMKQVEVRGVTLDMCPRCDGFWFDPAELKLLNKALEAERARDDQRDAAAGVTCSRCGAQGLKERDTFYAQSGLICAHCHSDSEVRSMNARAREERERYTHTNYEDRPWRDSSQLDVDLGDLVDFISSFD